MNVGSNILAMHEVSVEEGRGYDSVVRGVSLSLGQGDVVLVNVAGHQSDTPLADAAMGLCELSHGEVYFKGRTWGEMSPAEIFEARSGVGRVFGGSAWVSNLDLDENILLGSRHHHGATVEAQARMRVLADRFGVTEALGKRPAWVSRSECQRAQWVRALLGAPGLLLLEHPERGVGDEHWAALLDSVKESLQHGAGVIWITTSSMSEQNDAFPSAQRFRILNQAWLPDTI